MAKLILPKYAYRDIKPKDELYHLRWYGIESPIMVCGEWLWDRQQFNIEDIPVDKLCRLCLGAFGVK